jgi:hypothetical protein
MVSPTGVISLAELKAMHLRLNEIFGELINLGRSMQGGQSDTVFAMGLAAGSVSRAKALVGRDIDDTASEAK